MKILIRVALVLGAMVLVGCGGRPLAANKEAAAGALFQSSRGASSAQGALAQVLNSGAGTQTEVRVSCPRGGNVAIRLDVTSGTTTSLTYDLVYDGCNYDGRTSMRGTMHMTMDLTSGGTTAAIALHLQGRIELSGEISDFVDANVTETVTMTDLSSPSGTVTVTLDGTISTSSGTYTYTNEVITITPELQAAPDPA